MFAPATSFLSTGHKYSHEHFIVYRNKWENDMLIDNEHKSAFY